MHNCLVLLQTQHAIRQSHVSFGVRHLANSHYYLGNRCQNASVRALSSAFFFLWGAPSPSLTSSKSLADFNAAWINTTNLSSVAFYLITQKCAFKTVLLRTDLRILALLFLAFVDFCSFTVQYAHLFCFKKCASTFSGSFTLIFTFTAHAQKKTEDQSCLTWWHSY